MFREAGRVRSKKQLWAYGPSLPALSLPGLPPAWVW